MPARFRSGAVARLAVLASLTMVAPAARQVNAAAPRAIPKGWSTAQHDAKVAQEAVNARAAGKQTAAGTQADAGAADAQPSAAGEPGVAKEERLKDVAVLQGLVANLSAGDFATRETATRELMKAGREAFPLLRDAESTGDKETQSRARKILDEIEWPVTAAAIKKIKSLGGTVIGVDPKRPGGVSIQNCTDQPRLHIRDADVACIEDLHYLHVATFVRVDLADETCAHLAKLPNLKMIRLDDTDVSDVGVRRLLPLRRLAQLDLGKTKVTGTGFQDLTSISTLSEVELVDAAVTDEGMVAIGRCSSIIALALNGNRITDQGIKSLKQTKIMYLSLGETAVTDDAMAELRDQPLKTLDVSSTKITDRGVGYISQLKLLSYLNLRNTHVTNNGVLELAHLPKLEFVNLGHTIVTVVGIKNFAAMKHPIKIGASGLGIDRDEAIQLLNEIPVLKSIEYREFDGRYRDADGRPLGTGVMRGDK